jgi:uncharacterized membrane protein
MASGERYKAVDDRRLETSIGNLLRAGVLLSAVTVFAGGVLYLARHYAVRVSYHQFSAGGPIVQSFRGVLESAAHLNSEGLIQFGLLLLIATPVARVALAVVGFALEKDRLYAVVSLVVLVILVLSLMRAL